MATTKQTIRFFWNGVKRAGNKELVGGHWSYQAAQDLPGRVALEEKITFYAKSWTDLADSIAIEMGGTGFESTVDDLSHCPRFTLAPDSDRFADALEMMIKQEERAAKWFERREAKGKLDAYGRKEWGYQLEKIERLRDRLAELSAEPAAETSGHVEFLAALGVVA